MHGSAHPPRPLHTPLRPIHTASPLSAAATRAGARAGALRRRGRTPTAAVPRERDAGSTHFPASQPPSLLRRRRRHEGWPASRSAAHAVSLVAQSIGYGMVLRLTEGQICFPRLHLIIRRWRQRQWRDCAHRCSISRQRWRKAARWSRRGRWLRDRSARERILFSRMSSSSGDESGRGFCRAFCRPLVAAQLAQNVPEPSLWLRSIPFRFPSIYGKDSLR